MCVYEPPGAKGWESQGYIGCPKNCEEPKKLLWVSADTMCSVISEQRSIHWVLTVYDAETVILWGSGCVFKRWYKCFPEPFIIKDRYNIYASRAAWEQPWSRETRKNKARSTDLVCYMLTGKDRWRRMAGLQGKESHKRRILRRDLKNLDCCKMIRKSDWQYFKNRKLRSKLSEDKWVFLSVKKCNIKDSSGLGVKTGLLKKYAQWIKQNVPWKISKSTDDRKPSKFPNSQVFTEEFNHFQMDVKGVISV